MANEFMIDDETLTQDCRSFRKWSLCFESSCQLEHQTSKENKRFKRSRQRDITATTHLCLTPCIFPLDTGRRRSRTVRHRRTKIFFSCTMASFLWNLIIGVYAFHPLFNNNFIWSQRVNHQSVSLHAKISSSSAKQTIERVQPLTSSTKERRVSVEKAWEEAQSLAVDVSKDENLSSTPYLDLFTKTSSAKNLSNEYSPKQQSHARPRGRPESVPGAMSRTTLLTLNELQASVQAYEDQHREMSDVEELKSIDSFSSTQKRGRGRPKKNTGLTTQTSDEDIISATPSSLHDASNIDTDELELEDDEGLAAVEENGLNKSRKSRVKVLPKSRKIKECDMEDETTGMMPSGKSRQNGDIDTPNLQLQRYYRTPLLTQEDEYSLGMKIQFLMKCEQVHEGLYRLLGRAPSIVEWANACGFKEEDPVRSRPDYQETEVETQLRPVKSEAWDEEQDPNMFIGNGLAYDTGPGRGRGRAKKTPPTSLKDYYDDSDSKFCQDQKKTGKKIPINRGTPQDFIDMMLIGKEAKQKMVQSNMRLVVSISKRYKHVGVNVADLVQEGSIGLTRAAEKFDPKKGFKFSTYASWWIQQAVFRSIAYHSRTIRLPVHVHNLLNRVRRVRSELKRLYGRSPTNEEMAAELDISVEKFIKMLRLTRKAISLDMAKYQNNPKDIGQESETSLGDTIDAAEVIKDENSPQDNVDRTLFRDDLHEMLKILGDDERLVICARYGINDGLTRTVTAVAAQLGQTKSWVRSQECRALRKLRRPWYEKRLWEHQNSLRG